MNRWLVKKWFQIAETLIVGAMLWACSDDKGVAGGTTEDAGIIAELNVAGVTQKGPFAKGSSVTVQGIDCKTLKFTNELFEGSVNSDKGEFVVDSVTLSSICAVFEVSGYYLNELSGKKSSEKLTLHALTNLKDRKNVNINVLTELEYERVMYLVTEKGETFAEAKKQAEKEVLASFNIKGDVAGSFDEAEDLNIFEKGDGNAALLAVSVMVQANANEAKLAERLDEYSVAISQNGSLDDKVKTEIANWATNATATGKLDTIRKNIESWNLTDSVPAFETYVKALANGDSVTLSSSSSGTKAGMTSSSKNVEPAETSSSSGALSSGKEIASSSSSQNVILSSSEGSSNNTKDSYLNPNINYGEMTDSRDGQVYKTVKIGSQVWMAQNLNYEAKNSYCYNDSTIYCEKYGRLYSWAAAMESCPSDWHLPSKDEWNALFMAVGGEVTAGKILKSQTGWNNNGNGTDAFGFSALPAGERDDSEYFRYDGDYAYFWSATKYDSRNAYCVRLYHDLELAKLFNLENSFVFSIRCLKDYDSVASSSSSSAASSSSVEVLPPCKTETEDNCESGTLTDSRDGKTYRTVKIGDQVWMAENLNYAYTSIPFKYKEDASDSTSWCYNNDATNCEKYGRLYTWATAMDSSATWSDNGKDCGYNVSYSPTYPVQGICPSGWHLPSEDEWSALLTAVGGRSNAGKVLKSQYEWNEEGNGTDEFGFTALPAGYRDDTGKFIKEGGDAYFWGATIAPDNFAFEYANSLNLMYYSNGYTLYYYNEKYDGLSVRCVKN